MNKTLISADTTSKGGAEMSRRKKSIPVPDPDKQGLEYVCPWASWCDMTGLIPANTGDDPADESYGDLYQYLPEYEGKGKKS